VVTALMPPALAQTGSIYAYPNPCTIPSGQTQCTTTIYWSSQGTSAVEIWVSWPNGGSPSLFASSYTGGTHTQDASWIQANGTYVFTLYDYSSGSQGANLGSVSVTGVPTIIANPNPCSIPSGQTECTTTITWWSQGPSAVEIFLSANGGSPQLFASSSGGGPYSQNASWIAANNTYVFTLYDYSSGSQGANLGSVSVTGVPAVGPQSPTVYVLFNQASGLALVDVGYAQYSGYTIGQGSYDGGSDAQWQIISVGNGLYKIVNQASGLALVDAGYAQGNGYTIAQGAYDGGSNAQWSIVALGNGNYEIINQASGLALVDAGYAQGNGYTIGQWTYDGGSDAQWQIGVVYAGSGGFFDGSVGVNGPFGNGQYPTSVTALSVVPLPYQTFGDHGCPYPQTSSNYYGLEVDIEYQVLDQNFNPIRSSAMGLFEDAMFSQSSPFPPESTSKYGPLGPSNISDTSANTDSDGIFHDAPVGGCANVAFSSGALNLDQTIVVVVSGHPYILRRQHFDVAGPAFKHGSVSNGSDVNVTQ
jgi:Ricin-type beta-trefoil lectin domain-like